MSLRATIFPALASLGFLLISCQSMTRSDAWLESNIMDCRVKPAVCEVQGQMCDLASGSCGAASTDCRYLARLCDDGRECDFNNGACVALPTVGQL